MAFLLQAQLIVTSGAVMLQSAADFTVAIVAPLI